MEKNTWALPVTGIYPPNPPPPPKYVDHENDGDSNFS